MPACPFGPRLNRANCVRPKHQCLHDPGSSMPAATSAAPIRSRQNTLPTRHERISPSPSAARHQDTAAYFRHIATPPFYSQSIHRVPVLCIQSGPAGKMEGPLRQSLPLVPKGRLWCGAAGPAANAPACGRHKKAPLEGSCQAEGLTERCCRSALCGRLAGIATAPTPLRHGFAVPPLLKERFWGAVRCRRGRGKRIPASAARKNAPAEVAAGAYAHAIYFPKPCALWRSHRAAGSSRSGRARSRPVPGPR